MGLKSISIKNVMINISLLIISVIVTLLLVEIILRIFYPKYEYVANSDFVRTADRIYARKPNSHYVRKHPDSGEPHLVYHNNLALRQHRDFDKKDIESAINVAFFGDSMTENLRLLSQYSFTEPLDYLLNKNKSHKKYNTLNLGVDGYGTDQSFLYYKDFKYSDKLDYVFYLFSTNDLKDIYQNNLFSINERGELIQNKTLSTPMWLKVISKFYLTYFVLDIRQRVIFKDEKINKQNIKEYFMKDYKERRENSRNKRSKSKRAVAIRKDFYCQRETEDMNRCIAILKKLLHRWKKSVEENGGKFYIVIPPIYRGYLGKLLFKDDFDLVDIYEKMNNDIANYDWMNYRFENDTHWNERANQLTAVYLYRLIEKQEDLPPISTDALRKQLYTYYSTFAGWMPDDAQIKKTPVSPEEKNIIKAKYLALELQDVAGE